MLVGDHSHSLLASPALRTHGRPAPPVSIVLDACTDRTAAASKEQQLVQWLRERGVVVVDLDDDRCVDLLGGFIAAHPDLWAEDIGK